MWMRVSAVAIATGFEVCTAHAQVFFDVEAQVRRQSEQLQDLRTRNDTAASPALRPSTAPEPVRLPREEPCFPIGHVKVTGFKAHLYTSALAGGTLNDAPAGQCLGSGGVRVLLNRLQNALIADGYITARVTAPDQDMRLGELTLHILEGRLAAVRIHQKDSATHPVHEAVLAVQLGEALNLRDVEQSLENLRRLPGAAASIEISPGSAPGESELHIHLQPVRPVRWNLNLDDAGARSTGRLQASTALHWDNPLGLSDSFYVLAGRDMGDRSDGPRGQDNHVLHYSTSLGYWTLSASANHSRYHQQVAGAFQDYRYSGHSRGFELGASSVIHRAADRKTALSMDFFARRSASFIDDTEVQVQRRRTGGWELGIQHQQSFAQANLEIDYSYKRGTGAFGSIPAPEEAFNEGTSHMRRSQLGARLQGVSQDRTNPLWTTQWLWQWAHSTLTPQDRLCFGGRYTVRGFDGITSMCGEGGWTTRNEIGFFISNISMQTYLGLDGGRARGSSVEPSPWLLGSALGVRGIIRSGDFGRLHFDAFVAKPLRKPSWFKTSNITTGFNLQVQF